ncbi:MAG: ABC transporter ATP-binding protein [Actinomycetota bacterium]|nr:ABC transporter ATP-binding protein [Actinomycetota bacterium]
MAAVEVRELRKSYGDLRAVDGISFEIGDGEIYALLGENGAGKSTTVEILEGHRQRDAGEVLVLGMDPHDGGRELRDRVGIVLQSSGIEPEFTVAEAVDVYGSAYRQRRSLDEVVGMVGLDGKVDSRIGSLSGGQRRRLDLALGIVGRPELLFLDEPTTGFDPAARRHAWDLIASMGAGGTTVLLTTHYLDEAQHLADRVGIMAKGQLVAEGTPVELMAGVGTSNVSFVVPDGFDAGDLAAVVPADARAEGTLVTFTTSSPTAALHRITSWAVERDVELGGLSLEQPSLEDVYFQLAVDKPHRAHGGSTAAGAVP